MRSHDPAEGQLMIDTHVAEERALRDTVRRLSLAYPAASPEHIAAILQANFDATRDAKVQTYRLLLAERNTRVRLRREESSTGRGSWAWERAS